MDKERKFKKLYSAIFAPLNRGSSMAAQSKLKYFITGGGTGGHIYPALAVFEELLKKDTTGDIYYIGNKKNLEFGIIRSKNYKFLDVDVTGMPRKADPKIFLWGIKLILAILKSCFYIIKYRPDAIFGTGGYVSAPTVIAGKLLGVPYVLHDCDAKPGLVTRHLAKDAKSVSIAFEDAKKFIANKNIFVNGNPIRKEFETLTREEALKNLGLENKLTVCVMGGSQGAQTINNAAVKILKQLSDNDIQVIFQTGKRHFERVKEELITLYPDYQNDKKLIIRPYFEDMISVLKASDIAVARSGSLSLSEICASGVASILVPYPYAAADHQRINAKYMTSHGAALYLEDADTSSEKLLELITSLQGEKLKELQNNAFKLAKFDGVEKIVEQLNAGL